MLITASEVERYRRLISSVADEAEASVRALVLERCAGLDPGDACREARAIMRAAVDRFGAAAQAAACDLFDGVMLAEGSRLRSRTFAGLTDLSIVDAKVSYFGRRLFGRRPDLEAFAGDCARRAAFYARREAAACTVANASAAGGTDAPKWSGGKARAPSGAGRVMFARIPTGRETCTYCTMLAARGFQYYSAGSAAHASHEGCDCVIVPGTRSTTVEGYDTDELDRRWRAFKEIDEAKGLPADAREYLKRLYSDGCDASGMVERALVCRDTVCWGAGCRADVVAEIERRDRSWIASGSSPEVDYSLLSGKQKRLLDENELSGHEILRENGFDVVVVPAIRSRTANIDLMVGGEYWELKTPVGSGGKLHSRLDEGVSKWSRLKQSGDLPESDTPRIVVDNRFSSMPDQEAMRVVVDSMEANAGQGFDDAMVVEKGGKIIRIKKEAPSPDG